MLTARNDPVCKRSQNRGWDKTRIRNYGNAEAEKGIKRGKRDKTRKKG